MVNPVKQIELTTRVNKVRGTPSRPVWQKNYYEHVIRNRDELNQIREYILTKPMRWASERENPERAVRVAGAGAHRHAPLREPE